MMATLTQVQLICDVCGNSEDVQTQTIGLDGKLYEVDLCQKDNESLIAMAGDYTGKARKISSTQRPRRSNRKPRAKTAATRDTATTPGPKVPRRGRAGAAQEKAEGRRPEPEAPQAPRAKAKASREKAKATRSKPQRTETSSQQPAEAPGKEREKGIFVYGILPADIEIADEMPGVGENPGLLRIVRSDGLAALISELEPAGRLGSPDDLKAHREILDGTAAEVPVLPLRFGTVLASEDAVADELLAARHDEFADALQAMDGRAQFVAMGRYVGQAATPERDEAARALVDAMEGLCVASVTREPAHERDAVHVAFLMDASQEGEAARVIENLAREWEGRIELELLGPTAAYDFVKNGKLQA